jgi:hypothetical protein
VGEDEASQIKKVSVHNFRSGWHSLLTVFALLCDHISVVLEQGYAQDNCPGKRRG